MKTYIPENITYLVKKIGCTQDEFGAIFGLPRILVSDFAIRKGLPKIETLIQICEHFDISLDDFVYKSLAQESSLNENKVDTERALLKKQAKLIASLEDEVERLSKEIIKLRSQKSFSV